MREIEEDGKIDQVGNGSVVIMFAAVPVEMR